MLTLLAVVSVTLVGSFWCSLTEAALYTIPHARIETFKRFNVAGAERLAQLRDNIDEPIAAIIALNTAFNILGGIWAAQIFDHEYGHGHVVLFSALFTFIMLFFAEVVPKTLGVRYADKLAVRLAWPLQIAVWALTPITKASVLVTRLFGKSARLAHPTEEDIISMALLSEAGGKILPHEAKWIRNILRLNDVFVRKIMTPNSKIRRVSEKLPLSMTKVDAAHWRHNHIPVCKDDAPDVILGVVNRRTVFAAVLRRPPSTTMAELMTPAHFVRDDMRVHDLIHFFIRHQTPLAMVQDEHGALVGLVTFEDALAAMIEARIS
jgi:CBS domain containing-hemolysin-like protein